MAILILHPVYAGFLNVGILTDGPSYDLVESGGYLYTAQGTSVHVYDVSTREKVAALTWKSSLETVPTGSPVRGLTIDNGYLYVASETRFSIIDIRHAGIPELQGSVDNPYKGTQIRDVVVKGDTAYLAVYGGGIQVVDISDKAAPVFLSKIVLAGKNKPVRCTIDGNYLYVALEADNRLDILDISSPRSPVVTGSYKPGTPGYNSTYSVAVKNGYAYITEYHNGVRVIDVTNPAHPVEVTNLMDINANDIKIRGNYAYVSVRYQGFSIIDITDPRNIRVVGKASDVKYYNEGIYPTDKYTFISLESMGIGIYDTSVVTNPVTLNRINVMGGADATIVRDDYMYIGGHNDGVWIVDISDPARPEEISFLSTRNGRNSVIHLQGNYLYIAGIWAKLCIADVSDPANPRLVVDHFGDNINAVLPDGNYIYTDIGIIDWTNKASPVYVAKSSIFNGKLTKFNDRYLLVAGTLSTNRGLHIIDVSDKKNPRLVTTFDPGIAYKDVAVNGNIAVALTGSNVTTIDLSSINAPVRRGTASYPGKWSGFGITLNDTIAYAAGSGAGQVRAFDFSDPANIALIDQIQLYGDFDSIAYSDGYVFAGQKMAVYDIRYSRSEGTFLPEATSDSRGDSADMPGMNTAFLGGDADRMDMAGMQPSWFSVVPDLIKRFVAELEKKIGNMFSIGELSDDGPMTVTTSLLNPTLSPKTARPVTVTLTTVPTTDTTPILTPISLKPISSPVSLNGTSGKILRFYTVAPGMVKFSIHYGGNINKYHESCTDYPRAILRLAGSSVDTTLYNGVSKDAYEGNVTFNLVFPGNYSLTSIGCHDWRVKIDNA